MSKKPHPFKGHAGTYAAPPVPLPEPAPVVPEAPPEPIQSCPVVIRDGGGWSLYMLTFQGERILERKRVHGPDLRRVCHARAIHIMEHS